MPPSAAALAAYLYSAAASWAPLGWHDYTHASHAETEERYRAIVADLAAVALDPAVAPLFGDELGRVKTALLMLAIVSFESGGFRADVDTEEHATGDHGRAWCLAQLHDEAPSHYARGLTDRRSCFRAELRALHDSWALCPDGPTSDHLTGYTVGHCDPGEPQAVRRSDRAARWWTAHPFVGLGPIQ